MSNISVAYFYKKDSLEEIKKFSVPNDETLYYRTVVNAREYGDTKGYDGFSMDGDAYSLKDGKMTRVVRDTIPVDINPADETEFTKFIQADFAKDTENFADCVAGIETTANELSQ